MKFHLSRGANMTLLVLAALVLTVDLLIGPAGRYFWSVLVAATGVVAFAFVSDRRRKKRQDKRIRQAVGPRIDRLMSQPWSEIQGHGFEVFGWKGFLLAMLMYLGLGGWTVYAAMYGHIADVRHLMLGSFLVAVGIWEMPVYLQRLGKPDIYVDSVGVTTPLYERIAWTEISGIALRGRFARLGTAGYYELLFLLDHPRKAALRSHWTQRLRHTIGMGGVRNGVLRVGLSRERAEAHALARFLWEQATGFDYDWEPGVSPAYVEAAKRESMQRGKARNGAGMSEPHAETRDWDRRFLQNERVMREERSRHADRSHVSFALNMLGYLAMAVLLAWFFWR